MNSLSNLFCWRSIIPQVIKPTIGLHLIDRYVRVYIMYSEINEESENTISCNPTRHAYWYKYCFFLLQEEILARIDVSLSLFPKVIFQRLLTHVYSISNRVFPWEAGFLIFDSEENLILCEVNHGNSCSSLTLRGRHKKDNFRQIWKSLIDMFQVFSVCSFHFHSF